MLCRDAAAGRFSIWGKNDAKHLMEITFQRGNSKIAHQIVWVVISDATVCLETTVRGKNHLIK